MAAYAWMSVGAVLFALMNFFARLSSEHVSWTLVAAARAAIGAAIAIAVARVRSVPYVPKNTPAMWMRSIFGTVALSCTFYALSSKKILLGDAVTLLNLSPVFLALLAPIVLGERSGRRVLLALPLSLGGVVCIVRPPILFGGAAARADMILPASVALVGALFSAFAMMMLRRVGTREGPEAIATHFSLLAASTLSLMSLPHLTLPSPSDLLTMSAAGVCAGLAQLAMTRAYALELAARVSPFGYLSVVVSAALGALALHEWPTALAATGMALVIGGGVLVTVASVRDARRLTRRAAR